ncbi:unnamed protein product [Vitrella brassicaformis CCMP3155]|uniref:Uncharacterized protein n=2 Tax=Vitrella brassicaformis TaxID=1169539 RepID=A0A0G4GJL7_VITBC|nr:unnamed protein product [Vitrella brassicaformis CCMP3155]|eukprot:CEM30114.1 unnamed protein product [Vitrella brassicaformis CCMP3155]
MDGQSASSSGSVPPNARPLYQRIQQLRQHIRERQGLSTARQPPPSAQQPSAPAEAPRTAAPDRPKERTTLTSHPHPHTQREDPDSNHKTPSPPPPAPSSPSPTRLRPPQLRSQQKEATSPAPKHTKHEDLPLSPSPPPSRTRQRERSPLRAVTEVEQEGRYNRVIRRSSWKRPQDTATDGRPQPQGAQSNPWARGGTTAGRSARTPKRGEGVLLEVPGRAIALHSRSTPVDLPSVLSGTNTTMAVEDNGHGQATATATDGRERERERDRERERRHEREIREREERAARRERDVKQREGRTPPRPRPKTPPARTPPGPTAQRQEALVPRQQPQPQAPEGITYEVVGKMDVSIEPLDKPVGVEAAIQTQTTEAEEEEGAAAAGATGEEGSEDVVVRASTASVEDILDKWRRHFAGQVAQQPAEPSSQRASQPPSPPDPHLAMQRLIQDLQKQPPLSSLSPLPPSPLAALEPPSAAPTSPAAGAAVAADREGELSQVARESPEQIIWRIKQRLGFLDDPADDPAPQSALPSDTAAVAIPTSLPFTQVPHRQGSKASAPTAGKAPLVPVSSHIVTTHAASPASAMLRPSSGPTPETARPAPLHSNGAIGSPPQERDAADGGARQQRVTPLSPPTHSPRVVEDDGDGGEGEGEGDGEGGRLAEIEEIMRSLRQRDAQEREGEDREASDGGAGGDGQRGAIRRELTIQTDNLPELPLPRSHPHTYPSRQHLFPPLADESSRESSSGDVSLVTPIDHPTTIPTSPPPPGRLRVTIPPARGHSFPPERGPIRDMPPEQRMRTSELRGLLPQPPAHMRVPSRETGHVSTSISNVSSERSAGCGFGGDNGEHRQRFQSYRTEQPNVDGGVEQQGSPTTSISFLSRSNGSPARPDKLSPPPLPPAMDSRASPTDFSSQGRVGTRTAVDLADSLTLSASLEASRALEMDLRRSLEQQGEREGDEERGRAGPGPADTREPSPAVTAVRLGGPSPLRDRMPGTSARMMTERGRSRREPSEERERRQRPRREGQTVGVQTDSETTTHPHPHSHPQPQQPQQHQPPLAHPPPPSTIVLMNPPVYWGGVGMHLPAPTTPIMTMPPHSYGMLSVPSQADRQPGLATVGPLVASDGGSSASCCSSGPSPSPPPRLPLVPPRAPSPLHVRPTAAGAAAIREEYFTPMSGSGSPPSFFPAVSSSREEVSNTTPMLRPISDPTINTESGAEESPTAAAAAAAAAVGAGASGAAGVLSQPQPLQGTSETGSQGRGASPMSERVADPAAKESPAAPPPFSPASQDLVSSVTMPLLNLPNSLSPDSSRPRLVLRGRRGAPGISREDPKEATIVAKSYRGNVSGGPAFTPPPAEMPWSAPSLDHQEYASVSFFPHPQQHQQHQQEEREREGEREQAQLFEGLAKGNVPPVDIPTDSSVPSPPAEERDRIAGGGGGGGGGGMAFVQRGPERLVRRGSEALPSPREPQGGLVNPWMVGAGVVPQETRREEAIDQQQHHQQQQWQGQGAADDAAAERVVSIDLELGLPQPCDRVDD